jgi:hypothetical protein
VGWRWWNGWSDSKRAAHQRASQPVADAFSRRPVGVLHPSVPSLLCVCVLACVRFVHIS